MRVVPGFIEVFIESSTKRIWEAFCLPVSMIPAVVLRMLVEVP